MYDVTCHLLLNILIVLDVWLNQVSIYQLRIWTLCRQATDLNLEKEKNRNETKSVKSFVLKSRKEYTAKSIRIELNRMQNNFDSSLNPYLVCKNVTFSFVWIIIVTAIHWVFMIYLMFGKAIYGIKPTGICQTKSFLKGKNTRLNHSFFSTSEKFQFLYSSIRDGWTECIPNRFKFESLQRQVCIMQLERISFCIFVVLVRLNFHWNPFPFIDNGHHFIRFLESLIFAPRVDASSAWVSSLYTTISSAYLQTYIAV